MRPDSAVKSARRALEVVELLEKLQQPASVADIASWLTYPQSSTSVLLSGLRRLGYLKYDDTARVYSLSLRVALIGSGLRFGGQPTASVFELVDYVHGVTTLSTAIVTRNEIHMQYVYTMRGAEVDLVGYVPGRLLPLCRTAGGLALLSGSTEQDVGKIVRRINAEGGEAAPLELPSVLDELKQFRKAGYIYIARRVIPTVGSVAIRLPFNDVCGWPLALSVGGRAAMLDVEAETLARVMGDAVARFGWDSSRLPTSAKQRELDGVVT
jgi:DNA-binding IclR family transcriptional regulator